MDALPKRKNMRLKNYNYSQNGAYFITMCVKDKHELLGKILVGNGVPDVPQIELSKIGKIINSCIIEIDNHYHHININKYVIMPNHVHMVVIVNDGENGVSRTPHPTNAVIPSLISTLKRFANKQIGYSIWQHSYHDHIIRSEDEYQKIWKYIDENPQRWSDDCYFIKT